MRVCSCGVHLNIDVYEVFNRKLEVVYKKNLKIWLQHNDFKLHFKTYLVHFQGQKVIGQ